MLKGKIDILMHDAPAILWMAAMHELDGLAALQHPMTEEYLAWAVNKSNTELVNTLNETLARWEETGQLEMMIETRIPGWLQK